MANQPRPSAIPVPPSRQQIARVASPFSAPDLSHLLRIDELQQKIRTLEHTNTKLQAQIEREKTRYDTNTKDLKRKWQAEQKQWSLGCDTLQGCHRLAQLRILVDYSKQRGDALLEQDVARKEKLARLQRDFRITSFQRRERELEASVDDLQAKLDERLADTDSQAEKLKTQNTTLVDQATHREKELEELQQEIEGLQEELSAVRKDEASLRSGKDTKDTELERTTLRLQSATSTNAELQKTVDELKVSNAELKQRLQRWDDLEKKGGEEATALRKERVELQVQVQSLQEQLEEKDETMEGLQQQVNNLEEKVKRRSDGVEKANTIVKQWKDAYEVQGEDLVEANDQVTDLRGKLKQAKELVSKLRASAKASPTNASRPALQERKTHAQEDDSDVEAEEEAEVAMLDGSSPPPAPSPPQASTSKKPAPKRAKRPRTPEPEPPVDDVEEVSQTPQKPKRTSTAGTKKAKTVAVKKKSSPISPPDANQTKKGTRGKKNVPVAQPEDDDDDPPQETKPKAKGKGKQKAVPVDVDIEPISEEPEPEPEPIFVEDDEDVPEPATPSRFKAAPTNWTRRRITQPPADDAEPAGTKKPGKAATRKPASGKGKEKAAPDYSGRTKGGKSAPHPEPVDVDEDEHEIQQNPPKKKRKIGGFSQGSQAPPNLFGFSQQDTGVLGMIPTDLSPIKTTERVPARAASAMGGPGLTFRDRVASTFKSSKRV